MSTGTELERLQAIEARLLARWHEIEAGRLESMPLIVRMAENEEQRKIEAWLGYAPKRDSVVNWGQNDRA